MTNHKDRPRHERRTFLYLTRADWTEVGRVMIIVATVAVSFIVGLWLLAKVS